VSDTPADAAAWVTQSQTSGEGVSLWEIGNEGYGLARQVEVVRAGS
jgi:hypothetical protein